MVQTVAVVGGGLAGSEAAWQLAERGVPVRLYEMRPQRNTEAHVTDKLAELVCSNSLGSQLRDRATGLLQHELKLLGSFLLACADQSAVPAGGALAVDRERFSELVTERIEEHPNISIHREEMTEIPDGPAIIATGPLTSPALAEQITGLTGREYLYFYDAISPIVRKDSIDMDVAFSANRYGRGDTDEGDYINCPMSKEEYLHFVNALRQAECIELRNFEKEDAHFFEGCVPIEELARRGDETLAFGPLRPVGLTDPRTGERPYAIVQLRRDNLAGDLYNMVGFQTNIRWGEQKEVLRMIPGLHEARFVRMGQMHRNTFINSPALLEATMRFRLSEKALYFAGQITGIEGYVGNIATGFVAAINLYRSINQQQPWIPTKETMLGALCHYVTHTEEKHFQPMKANFGILPPLEGRFKNKRERASAYADRALAAMQNSIAQLDDTNIYAQRYEDTTT